MYNINTLIIDDHHLMVESYKSTLRSIAGFNFEITIAHNCEESYKAIMDSRSEKQFDLVFLDIQLPKYAEMGINSGEDLAELIKEHMPECKIIILTSHTQSIVLYNLIKKINPNGILVKSDFGISDLIKAVTDVFKFEIHHSKTVKISVNRLLEGSFFLDSYNRQIIMLLSKGVKTRNLCNYIPLSTSAIDKRKVQIKIFLNIESGNDDDIIREAKKAELI